jgi:hypothetical protein
MFDGSAYFTDIFGMSGGLRIQKQNKKLTNSLLQSEIKINPCNLCKSVSEMCCYRPLRKNILGVVVL